MGMLSEQYDSSFGSTEFLELYDGLAAVRPDTVMESSITHIPGGNVTIVETSGLIAKKLDLPIGADEAQIAALEGKVGTRATLVYHRGSVSARLMAVKNGKDVYSSGSSSVVLELILG